MEHGAAGWSTVLKCRAPLAVILHILLQETAVLQFRCQTPTCPHFDTDMSVVGVGDGWGMEDWGETGHGVGRIGDRTGRRWESGSGGNGACQILLPPFKVPCSLAFIRHTPPNVVPYDKGGPSVTSELARRKVKCFIFTFCLSWDHSLTAGYSVHLLGTDALVQGIGS